MGNKPTARVPDSIRMCDRSSLASWGAFYVGGEYELFDENVEGLPGLAESSVMRGQMYVEVYVPQKVAKPYPLVCLPGNHWSGLYYLTTPDGRPGLAQYFWERGYIVYVCDVPSRGRADCMMKPGQEKFVTSAEKCERLFAGKGDPKYTQWPGSPDKGTPVFDNFYATSVPSLTDNAQMQSYAQKAGAALLDRIGPAILVNHSQSGPFGWLIADARPGLVKGLMQFEPKGPPFHDDSKRREGENAVWGLTEIRMNYDPPASAPEELRLQPYTPEDPGLRAGWMQEEPARRLPNLRDVPIAIITSTSTHSAYDYLTVMYLKQAGVRNVTHIDLKKHGQPGNSHVMIVEKNTLEIFELCNGWLEGITG